MGQKFPIGQADGERDPEGQKYEGRQGNIVVEFGQ